MVKRQTVSFVSRRSSEQFAPRDRYFESIYRFKAIRCLITNPEIRVNSINHSLYVEDTKPTGEDIKDGDVRTFPIMIPSGDYTVTDLIRCVQHAMAAVVPGITAGWDEKHCRVYFVADEEDRYSVLNGVTLEDKENGYEHSITRTLGFDGTQGVVTDWIRGSTLKIAIGKERVCANILPYNIYELDAQTHHSFDGEIRQQLHDWTVLLPHMYREIGREVVVQMNSFSCVRTYHTDTDFAAVRGIAKINLGAPGLPSKRLIASEMGSRTPFDQTIAFRYVYLDGKLLDDTRGFSASTELLVFYK